MEEDLRLTLAPEFIHLTTGQVGSSYGGMLYVGPRIPFVRLLLNSHYELMLVKDILDSRVPECLSE